LETSQGEGWAITVAADQRAMSELAADMISDQLTVNPHSVLSLPTGSTPLTLFDILAARTARGVVDFSNVTFFSLDDYLGLKPSDANSLSGWLVREFLHRVNLQAENVHLVPSDNPSPIEAANVYDAELTRRGGFDLVVLGMGENGHIAFNEPGSDATTRTRVVDLTPETREQAAAYWDDQFPMPAQAMTIGMANILEARRIVLLVSGEAKAPILNEALSGAISPRVPASLLRLAGPRLHVFTDADAASTLNSA
jgi:glucosamine-6-phosphate deaminase